MMRIALLCAFSMAMVFSCGDGKQEGAGSSRPMVGGGAPGASEEAGVVEEGFRDQDTYVVVCGGIPLEGSTGVAKNESAKRAAKLCALSRIKSVFGDAVRADSGSVEKFEMKGDTGVVTYVVSEKGLRNRAQTHK